MVRIPSGERSASKAGIVRWAASLALLASCSDSPRPNEPLAIEPCDSTFCVALPIAAKDTAFAAYGVWPFGVHGSSHAIDGHPGWDIEYKVGGQALAAEAGTVLSLFADTATGTTTVQLSHVWHGKNYRTVYTAIATVAAGVTVGAAVTRGQVLGVPRSQTRMIGTRTVTYAAIHFQFDDFSSTDGLTNVNAVSPEGHLLADARVLFAAMWAKTGYSQELCEPFMANPRSATYPLTRRWTSGVGASARLLDVMCQDSPTNPHLFVLDAPEDKSSGSLLVNPLAGGLGEIDFNRTGTVQRGLYRVVSDSLWLQVAVVGAPRPAALTAPQVYVTSR